jgi:hypothetical protein
MAIKASQLYSSQPTGYLWLFDCTLFLSDCVAHRKLHDYSRLLTTLGSPVSSLYFPFKHDMKSMAGPSDDAPTAHCDSLPRLTHTQRSRLVKSTRKLAKILGEHPMSHVNRPSAISSFWKKSPESNTAILRRRIFPMAKKPARTTLDPLQMVHRQDPDSDNEDMRSIKSGPGEVDTLSGRNWSSMLVLHAISSLDSEIDGHGSYVSSQVPSPAMSSFQKRPSSVISTSTSKSTLFSPAEWEKSKEEREISQGRKRLSKLARHLGERIPPDLILPKPRSVKSNRRSPRGKRSSPDLTPPVPPLRVDSPTSEQGTASFFSPPFSLLEVTRPAVEKTVEVFESPDAVPPPRFSQKHRYPHSRFSAPLLRERATQSPTDGYFEVIDHADAISFEEEGRELETGPLVVGPRRPESRLGFLRLRPTSPPPASKVVSHRSERRQGWSGEWNVANMQDVISKLRDL